MKRIWMLLLLCALALTACRQETAPDSVEEAAAAIRGALSAQEFTRADDDFLHTNFASDGAISEGAVYLSNVGNEIREFGVFRLNKDAKESDFERCVRTYLEGETDSLRALSALYPGETLANNLNRYQNASVEQRGGLLYYFVLEESEKDAARAGLAAN